MIQNIFFASPDGNTYINPEAIGSVQIQRNNPIDPTSPFNYLLVAPSGNVIYASVEEFTTGPAAFAAIAAIIESAIALNSELVTTPSLVNLT